MLFWRLFLAFLGWVEFWVVPPVLEGRILLVKWIVIMVALGVGSVGC